MAMPCSAFSRRKIQDVRLHRDIERRENLVAEQQRRLRRQRPRDRHALPLAAG